MFRRTLSSREVRLLAVMGILSIVIVVGVASVLSFECQTSGYCLAPFTPSTTQAEVLNLDRYTITTATGQSNPTILNMWIQNTGSAEVTISSLSIRDLTTGGGPVSFQTQLSIARGATANLSVDTSNSGFSFTGGHSYSLAVVTSKNTQFTFHAIY